MSSPSPANHACQRLRSSIIRAGFVSRARPRAAALALCSVAFAEIPAAWWTARYAARTSSGKRPLNVFLMSLSHTAMLSVIASATRCSSASSDCLSANDTSSTQTYACMYICKYTHMRAHTRTHAHACAHAHARTHACMYTRTLRHTHTHARSLARTHARSLAVMCCLTAAASSSCLRVSLPAFFSMACTMPGRLKRSRCLPIFVCFRPGWHDARRTQTRCQVLLVLRQPS